MTIDTRRADVVIVGAGVAGLSAAIAAGEAGANVLLVDSAKGAGGTAATAGGGVCIAGSPLQRQLGVADNVELALEDWRTFGGSTADLDWAERYLRASSDTLWTLLAEVGVHFYEVRWNEGNRVPRWHAPAGGGKAVMAGFERRARACSNIQWALETKALGLIVEGGAVRGIRLAPSTRIGTEEAEVRTPSLLLATGGFANNAELIHQHAAVTTGASRILLGGGSGAKGDGLRMLDEVQADTVNLDAVWMYPYGLPDDRPVSDGRGLVVRSLQGEVWVNRDGQRFHDETRRGGASGTPALLAQDGATCWSIIDAEIARRMTVADPRYRDGDIPDRAAINRLLERSPWISQANDLVALGDQAGIDGLELRRTVENHNKLCGTDNVDEFGRNHQNIAPLTEPPFYALQFFPLARKNLGGVRTNHSTQVLNIHGKAVEGLFAAGEVAGMAGGSINGRAALEGTMFGPSLFSGTVAGAAVL